MDIVWPGILEIHGPFGILLVMATLFIVFLIGFLAGEAK
jgi:hypothetical protein